LQPSIQVDLPKNAYSEADFYVYWKKYIEILTIQGEKMLTAILNSTEPQVNLETNQIKLIYPNAMMMEEVKKNQSPIINYLRDQLQNFDLSFDLHYNEENEKTFVYTPQEKYSKLMEINPLLAEFRKLFDLDI
jgi:DNA polymerase-3 subunit gamma/tau